MFPKLLIVLILFLSALAPAAAGEADKEKKPFAFVIGYSGGVTVGTEKASLGMAVYDGDLVKAGAKSAVSILLIDDSLYKVGAQKNVKISSSLVKGDIKKFPKKDGTWAILYKKFQDRVKAQKDITQYGAVRKAGFQADFSTLTKADVKMIAAGVASNLNLTPKHEAFYFVTGSIWEYHSYYEEAHKIYKEGLAMFPTSKDLLFASSIVSAKSEGKGRF